MKSFLYSLAALMPLAKADILPNSCRDLEDGEHWLKLMDGDDYPAVLAQCSNGYIVLDYSKDNNLKEYFNTWAMWHVQTAGPTNDVHINWQEWYLPDDGNTEYGLSPDCTTCEMDHQRQIYDSQTTYWMTGTLFGCFWAIKGAHNCDVDWDTDACYTCIGTSMQDQGNDRIELTDESPSSYWRTSGICPHNVQSADHYVPLTHDACTHEESSPTSDDVSASDNSLLHLKPSIGTEGKYCVCVSPSTTQYFEIDEIPSEPLTPEEEIEPTYQYTSLTNEDFKYGTYRITEPGTYKIMEDIVFDFNAVPSDPNSEGAYLPQADQNEDYPGSNDYRDAYFLGFFAGITVECDDVIIDLNGHTLEMSEYFYYQQRWFTTIELSTQYFLPGQGIGNFGAQPKVASNVIIKDGTLGLTTHHGIHGNYNNDILIENVNIRDFETCGIQFNGFSGVTIKNVEVGPTSYKAFFNGEYGHMRLLLPRYKKIAEETIGETIQFDGREVAVTMQEIAEEIEKQMNMAFEYVVNDVTYSEDDDDYESFQSALELFVNEEGIPNGGAMYGIFLNTFGASVFTYNLYTGYYSTDAVLENVKIYGMKHNMDEYIRLHYYQTGDIVINPFNGPLELRHLFHDVDDLTNPKYKGNILTDAYMAANYLSDNFYYLQLQLILNDVLVAWALGEKDFWEATGTTHIQIGCNSDVMIHSGKGISGLRLDGVDGVTVKNLEVYSLHDSTTVGVDTCGSYDDFCALCGFSGGHFRQTQPMQVGFSGNMAQAINVNAAINVVFEDVTIYDIKSETGPTFGMSIWPACDVTLKGDINVKELESGAGLEKGTYSYSDLPNKAPETCAVRVYWQYSDYATTVNSDDANINTQCISGHVGCVGSADDRTLLGEYNEECNMDGFDDSFQDDAGSYVIDFDDSESSSSKKKKMESVKKSKAKNQKSANIENSENSESSKLNVDMNNKHKNKNNSFLPKQNVLTVLFEIVIFSAVLFGLYKLFGKRNIDNKLYQPLTSTDNINNDYATRNVIW